MTITWSLPRIIASVLHALERLPWRQEVVAQGPRLRARLELDPKHEDTKHQMEGLRQVLTAVGDTL